MSELGMGSATFLNVIDVSTGTAVGNVASNVVSTGSNTTYSSLIRSLFVAVASGLFNLYQQIRQDRTKQ